MSLPLDGVRVIELAQIYAGPYCGLQLAHFGAEVIKVEPPGEGEFLRMRPPSPRGANSNFLMLNPGKKLGKQGQETWPPSALSSRTWLLI